VMLSVITNNQYKILGGLIVVIGVAIFTWGQTRPELKNLEELKILKGNIEEYEILEGKASFQIEGWKKGLDYSKAMGNLEVLIDLLQQEGKSRIDVMIRLDPLTDEIYSLNVNNIAILTAEHKNELHSGWKKSINNLSLAIVLIGLIGFLFGDRLVKVNKALD